MTPEEIVRKHRWHVELSPGAGEDAQKYAIAVCDDILSDLQALRPEEELAMPRTDEIKMACGEMTAQELRTVKAVLGWFIRKNSKPQSRAFPTSCPKCGHSTSVHARDQEWKARCLNCNASLDAAGSDVQTREKL